MRGTFRISRGARTETPTIGAEIEEAGKVGKAEWDNGGLVFKVLTTVQTKYTIGRGSLRTSKRISNG